MPRPLDSTSALHIVAYPIDGRWIAKVRDQQLWEYGPTAIDAIASLQALLQDAVWKEVFG